MHVCPFGNISRDRFVVTLHRHSVASASSFSYEGLGLKSWEPHTIWGTELGANMNRSRPAPGACPAQWGVAAPGADRHGPRQSAQRPVEAGSGVWEQRAPWEGEARTCAHAQIN